jgi:hypothetical protein
MAGFPEVTEAMVVEGWVKWGDGSPLAPGFAKWLTDQLNAQPPPPALPVPEPSFIPLFPRYLGPYYCYHW